MQSDRMRNEFLIKDLVVRIGGGRGGTWMPGPDDETPPTPISPIASVLTRLDVVEIVRGTILEAIKSKNFDGIGVAIQTAGLEGNPVIAGAIKDVGAAVVAAAAYASLGGEVGLVNPDCGGTSFETIPPTITPVVHHGRELHRVSELGRLRKQLAETVAYLDKAATVSAPQGREIGAVRAELESAIKQLG